MNNFINYFLAVNEFVRATINNFIVILPQNVRGLTENTVVLLRSQNVLSDLVIVLISINLVVAALVSAKSIVDTLAAIAGLGRNQSFNARVFFLLKILSYGGKKQKQWGIVYDSVSKKPVDPAMVTISTSDKRLPDLKQSRVTDVDGRFSFLVPPGSYVINVEKSNFRFPSKIIEGKTDGRFGNVYHGEVIEVANPNIINLSIPMDPVSFDWNQSVKPTNHILFDFLKENFRFALIMLGVGFSAVTYIILPIALNLSLIFVYLFNLLFWKGYTQKRLWGVVRSKITGEAMQSVGVRAIRMPYNLSIAYTITDYIGRYFLLLSQGKYTIQVETIAGKGEKPDILAKFENVLVNKKKDVISFDIGV